MPIYVAIIVDDNEGNAVVAERQLAAITVTKAFTIYKAKTAEEGLEMARLYQPSFILMDIHLPGMDGIEATRILKADSRTSQIPIIAVTATSKFTKDQLVEQGFEDMVVKPVTLSRLLVAIRRLQL